MTFYGNVLAGERTEKCGAREKDNKKRPSSDTPPHPHNEDAVMNMIVLIITL
jgi:hypothetical protein